MQRIPQDRQEVVALVCCKENQLLIAQRKLKDGSPGLWEFPGGKREAQESREQALHREIFEELNIKIDIGTYLGENDFESAGRKYKLCVFFGMWTSGELQCKDHYDLRWVEPNELGNFQLMEADLPFIPKVLSYFESLID